MKRDSIQTFFTKNYHENSLMLFSLLAHILAGITSMGYHHADEHFQILEPIGWKLGLYGPQNLAWEFTEQIRPGLQIAIGVIVGKVLMALGAWSPFMLAATLRQMGGLLWWALSWAFYRKLKNSFADGASQKALLIFTALLWFLPYLHVRFSSESWGGLFFFGGLYLLHFLPNKNINMLFGALLMGLSFYFRFQLGFAIAGYLAWALWFKKYSIVQWLLLFAGGVVASCIGTLADFWLYGEWVLTPYNYFFQNITMGKAAGFGTSPFYRYLSMFIEAAAPPISIMLLVLLFSGLWQWLKTPYAWIFLFFVVSHSAVAHKEFRFMFPMAALVPVLCAVGVQPLLKFFKKLKPLIRKWSLGFFVGLNILLMTFSLVKPASETEAVFKAFFIVHENNPGCKIAFTDKDPFDNGLKMNFFRYCGSCFYKLEQDTSAVNYIFSSRIAGLPLKRDEEATLEYSSMPILPEKFNIGGWQGRSNRGFLWKISRKQEEINK